MARPLSFLIFAMAVGCVALFMLLPISKIAQHKEKMEASSTTRPAIEEVSEPTVTRQPDAPPAGTDTPGTGEQAELEE